MIFVPKGESHKKPRICRKHFIEITITMKSQTYIRIIGMIGKIYNHTILHFLQYTHYVLTFRIIQHTSYLVSRCIIIQLSRYISKKFSCSSTIVDLSKIIQIEFQNFPFHSIRLTKIIRLKIFFYSLWHSTNKHIKAKPTHSFSMSSFQRDP